jgi:hypothetical protein
LILSALSLRAALLFSNAPLLVGLSLLLLTLLLLTLACGCPLLFVSLPALLILRLSLLLLTLLLLTLTCSLPLLCVSLSTLLVLRLSFVVPALGFSLLALLIVLTPTAAPTAFVLRLSRLLVSPLLPFGSLLSAVIAVLRLLRVRETTRAWQKHHTNGRGQRDPTKVIAFHD